MPFETPITIKAALDQIHRQTYVLPAIQREFVWRAGQIERLFDSLMRGYPIGSFLYWKVQRENVHDYRFYDFMFDYDQRKPRNNPINPNRLTSDITAILDGQQRLTALNIGIRGSYASKLPRLWWNNPDAFPKKRLYIDLLRSTEEDEDSNLYSFRFLTQKEACNSTDDVFWYCLKDILKIPDEADIVDIVYDKGIKSPRNAHKTLIRLHRLIYTDGVIARYEEDSQDLHKVVNIFVRVNSGGTVLSYSDILMSMATAQWDELDARAEIYGLVDEINDIRNGFAFDKDWVLKAALVLSDIPDVGFKVSNFNSTNMKHLQRNWEQIKTTLRTTVRLISRYGFSRSTLTATNAALPIAYYIQQRDLGDELINSHHHASDRESIRLWLTRSLLKRGFWGAGVDSLLGALRSTIREHGATRFPSGELYNMLRARGRSLSFENEELEDLVENTRRAFLLLSLLFPSSLVRDSVVHIDHVFPRSRFTRTRLRKAEMPDDEIDRSLENSNRLPNMQLLNETENMEKSDRMPREWIDKFYNTVETREGVVKAHDLGDIPQNLAGFNGWYEARRERMLGKLRNILEVDPSTSETEPS